MNKSTLHTNEEVTCQECDLSYNIVLSECPQCHAVNPALGASAGHDSNADFGPETSAAGTPLAASADVLCAQTQADAARPQATQARMAPTPVQPKAAPPVSNRGATNTAGYKKSNLTEHIKMVKARANPIVIVFGTASSGKTFLVGRLGDLDRNRDATIRQGVIQATKLAEFNPIEIEITGITEKITIIDIPGESFDKAMGNTADWRSEHDMALTSIGAMNGAILYISANELTGGQFAYRIELYLRLLNIIYQVGNGVDPATASENTLNGDGVDSRTWTKSVCPIFVAVSQADRLIGRAGRGAAEKFDFGDPKAFVEHHAKGLTQILKKKFSYFSYGFVASHCEADRNSVLHILDFMTGVASQSLAKYKKSHPAIRVIRSSPDLAPFKDFIEESWVNQVLVPKPEDQLSMAFEAGRNLASHQADAMKFFTDGSSMLQLAPLVRQHGIMVSRVAIMDHQRDSFGVNQMLLRVVDMLAASKARLDDSAVRDFIDSQYPHPALAKWVRHVSASYFPRWLTWQPEKNIPRAATLALFAILSGLLLLYAHEVAENNNSTIKSRLADASYPANFRVKPSDAWSLSSDEADRLASSVAAYGESFRLESDILVRSPDLEFSRKVKEAGVTFEALRVPNADGAQPVESMFRTLAACRPSQRDCTPSWSSAVRNAFGEDGTVAVTRVERYARALYAYVSLVSSPGDNPAEAEKKITGLLREFETRRENSFGTGKDHPNKQKRLPHLAAGLITAHTRFIANANTNKREALIAYGHQLDEVLGRGDPVSAPELRSIGVAQGHLAMHLVGATLVAESDRDSAEAKILERLTRIGIANINLLIKDSALVQPDSGYAELLCLTGELVARNGAKPDDMERWYKTCSDANPSSTQGSPLWRFWQRRELTRPESWKETGRMEMVELEKLLTPIKKAAKYEEYLRLDPGDAGADTLTSIRSMTHRTALSILLTLPGLLLMGLIAASCTAFLFGLRFLFGHAARIRLGQRLFTHRYEQDRRAD